MGQPRSCTQQQHELVPELEGALPATASEHSHCECQACWAGTATSLAHRVPRSTWAPLQGQAAAARGSCQDWAQVAAPLAHHSAQKRSAAHTVPGIGA